MSLFFQQIVDGVTSGAIYAALALALVFVHQSTGAANFAQGEMAMFTTYITWSLTDNGVPVLLAIAAGMVAGFITGALVERLVIRRVESRSTLSIIVVTIGLFIIFNALAGYIWGFTQKAVPSAFPSSVLRVEGVAISAQSIGTVGVLVVVVICLWVVLQHTKVGLAMRAVASNKQSSQLAGIDASRMLMLGWATAAGLGSLAGSLIAPKLFLEPNMMQGVLLYAFAAAALGGFDSAIGAVVGALIVGISENLAGTYISAIGPDLKIVVPLVLIFITLTFRPTGLFGKKAVARV